MNRLHPAFRSQPTAIEVRPAASLRVLPFLLAAFGLAIPAIAATVTDTIHQASGDAYVGGVVFHPVANGADTSADVAATTDTGGSFSLDLPANNYTVTAGNTLISSITVPVWAGSYTLTELSTNPLWDGTDLAKIYGNTTIIGGRTNLILADPSMYGDLTDTIRLWALGPVDPATGLRVTRAYTLDQLGLTGSSLGGNGQGGSGNTISATNTTVTVNGLTGATNTTTTISSTLDLSGLVASTNGVSYGLVAKQIGTGTNWPITIYADDLAGAGNGYSIGNGYISGGTGGPYPVAFFRPTTPGYTMPFDLMPNGGNADVWMDFCADDIYGNQGSALNFLDIRQRGLTNGNYAEITTDAWGIGRVPGDLRLQTRGSGSTFWVGTYTGTPVALSRFDATQHYFNFDDQDHRFGTFAQFRMAANVNLAWNNAAGTVLIRAAKDDGNNLIPLNIAATPINLTGSNVTLSFDNNWVNRTPQQFRPATGVNLGVSSVGPAVQLSAFNDVNNPIPMVSKATSFAWSTDGGATYGLVFSNNVATATAWATTGAASVGGNLAVNGASTVGALNIGGTMSSTSGRLKLSSPTFISADGLGIAYTTAPIQLRPASNVNFGLDSFGGALRVSAFNDSATPIAHVYQAQSHRFTTDGGVTYALAVSNSVVTASNLTVSGKSTLGTLTATTGKIGNPVPSNRSSLAPLEVLMGNGVNGTALFQTFGGASGIYTLTANGTADSPTPTTIYHVTRLAALGLDTAGSTNWALGASVDFTPSATWSPTDHGMTAGFSATPAGTTTRIVNVLDTGTAMAVASSTATTPAATAVLDLQSVTTGFLPPRLNKTQRTAITNPAEGLQVANTTDHKGSYYNGTRWYNTPQELAGSATLDFGSIAPGTQADLTVTVTGAQTGDSVILGLPPAPTGGIVWNAFVSATDTVTLRASNISGSPVDPVAAVYKVKVLAQ
jgi:hypothetical protein